LIQFQFFLYNKDPLIIITMDPSKDLGFFQSLVFGSVSSSCLCHHFDLYPFQRLNKLNIGRRPYALIMTHPLIFYQGWKLLLLPTIINLKGEKGLSFLDLI
jgi:hypothetical protein